MRKGLENYQSKSPKETEEIAIEFAKKLKIGDVVTLDGDLGAGKTAFTQGLAKGLGVQGYVNSPTFTIINCYEGDVSLYHFDVYRIENCDEMYEIGYDEYVGGDGIAVIEWSEKIAEILPLPRYEIVISRDVEKGDNFRNIAINYLS